MQKFTKTVTKQFNTLQYKTTHYNAKQNITTQNKTKKPIQCRTIKYSSKTIQYIAIQYITI